MTKKNNPFKMRGSYVGAIVGFICSLLSYDLQLGTVTSFSNCINTFANPICRFWKLPFGLGYLQYGTLGYFFFILPYFIIIGFFIGWAINSLYRKYN